MLCQCQVSTRSSMNTDRLLQGLNRRLFLLLCLGCRPNSKRKSCSKCYILDMDPKIVESQLRSHKIREGPIYKRTKFLQEWRERWMVLTMNYILIFTSRNLKELAEFIDLREVKTYKSYLRKEEDMIPAGFKIRTLQDMFYFCARNCNEKWTWIVSIERLMDFKYAGKSPYNNAEWIRTKGFMGQRQFERGKFDEPEFEQPKQPQKPIVVQKPKEEPKPETPKVSEADYQNKLKLLEEQMARLQQREADMIQKERQQEEIFLFELNKLKKTEQSLKEQQLQLEERARQVERILAEGAAQTKEIIKEVSIQQQVEEIRSSVTQDLDLAAVQKAQEQLLVKEIESADKTNQQLVQQPEVVPEKLNEPEPEKPAVELTSSTIVSGEGTDSPQPEPKLPEGSPVLTVKSSGMSKRIEDMKNFFESKRMGMGPQPVPLKKEAQKKLQKKDEGVALHMCRDRVVVNLLQEFHSKAYNYAGLRFIIEFLVRICSDRTLGYQSFLIRQAKANQNRFLFAQVLLQLINDFKRYDQFGSLAKIIEVLIFEAPGIFKLNHFDLVKRKLVDLLYHAPEQHADLPALLKTLYVVHKMKNLEKNQQLKEKLTNLTQKLSSVDGKNWARKLIEDL